MVRGPAPKPSKLRLLEGTDRRGHSGRMLDRSREPVAPEGELLPPYELAPEAQQIWDATVEDLTRMKVASPADRHLIVAFVEAAALHARASRELAGQSLIVDGSRSEIANKLVMIRDRAATQLRLLGQELGLSPASRSRVETTTSTRQGWDGGNPFAGPDSDFFSG